MGEKRMLMAAVLGLVFVGANALGVLSAPLDRADEANAAELVEGILTGPTPSDRHQAIRETSRCNWRKNPQIVAALVKTARLDADRAVRVHAIRQMTHLKMDDSYVAEHLRYLRNDPEKWVREESKAALEKLAIPH